MYTTPNIASWLYTLQWPQPEFYQHLPRTPKNRFHQGFKNKNWFLKAVLTTRKNDDSWARTTVSEHLAQAFFLVRSQARARSQIDVDVSIARVVGEIVFSQKWEIELNTPAHMKSGRLLRWDRHAGRKDNLEPLLERFQVILTNFEGHHLRVDFLFFVVKLLVKIEDIVRNLWFALPILALRLLWRTCKGWLRGKWRHDSFWCAGLVSLENMWDDRTSVHFKHYQK